MGGVLKMGDPQVTMVIWLLQYQNALMTWIIYGYLHFRKSPYINKKTADNWKKTIYSIPKTNP